MKLTYLIIALLMMSPAQAFVGRLFKRGENKDEDEKPRPPPAYDIQYINSTKQNKTVLIDLTSAEGRRLDLQRTGWIVHQGQKIVLQDFELKGNNFVWDHDFSSCKDDYFRKESNQTNSKQTKNRNNNKKN